jgi:hypothetical protein
MTVAGTRTAPIKIDLETDQLVSHAAHFLSRSKKDVVDDAIREYVERHRDEIQQGVSAALRQLDGSTASMVSLLTGSSREELEELGGFRD